MDSFNDSSLSAYFPGLVDICINDDGQLVYAILKDGKLVFAQDYMTETESFSIPEKKHFKFTIPRASEVMRYFAQEDPSLYDDLLAYLKRFSALDDEQWAIVTHYIFLTYLHDHPEIDYCPYILFYAVPERGKSRTGKSVTYVAFRGIHLVELREAAIFRYSQNIHGTIFFDLQDISKKADRSGCSDILLLRSEKGAKCSRVQYPDQGPFNDTVYYDIYGPTIIASNEQLDKILETRCLQIIMPNRPGDYENPRPKLGLSLKERLTAWRARHLSDKFRDMEPIRGISGRLWDITKPLFFVNSILPIDSQTLQSSIIAIAGEKDQSRKDTIEGRLVAIIMEISRENGFDNFSQWTIKVNDIRAKYNEGKPEDRQVYPQWVGKRLKSMSLRTRIVHGHAELKITTEEYDTLLEQYGYEGRESGNAINSLPNKNEQNQEQAGEVESGRESARLTFNNPDECLVFSKAMEDLNEEGGRSEEEKITLAMRAVEEWRKLDDAPF